MTNLTKRLNKAVALEVMGDDMGKEWCPTESVPHAHQVLEKLLQEYCIHLDTYWTVVNYRLQCGIPCAPWIIDEGAETFPLAVCKFALKLARALKREQSKPKARTVRKSKK